LRAAAEALVARLADSQAEIAHFAAEVDRGRAEEVAQQRAHAERLASELEREQTKGKRLSSELERERTLSEHSRAACARAQADAERSSADLVRAMANEAKLAAEVADARAHAARLDAALDVARPVERGQIAMPEDTRTHGQNAADARRSEDQGARAHAPPAEGARVFTRSGSADVQGAGLAGAVGADVAGPPGAGLAGALGADVADAPGAGIAGALGADVADASGAGFVGDWGAGPAGDPGSGLATELERTRAGAVRRIAQERRSGAQPRCPAAEPAISRRDSDGIAAGLQELGSEGDRLRTELRKAESLGARLMGELNETKQELARVKGEAMEAAIAFLYAAPRPSTVPEKPAAPVKRSPPERRP
jgi:hypothetical protein